MPVALLPFYDTCIQLATRESEARERSSCEQFFAGLAIGSKLEIPRFTFQNEAMCASQSEDGRPITNPFPTPHARNLHSQVGGLSMTAGRRGRELNGHLRNALLHVVHLLTCHERVTNFRMNNKAHLTSQDYGLV